jgi:8-oxo-dGTP diphosphatase
MADRADKSSLVHVVAGILRDSGGRVLLAQRPEGKQHAGCWEFPGGKVEPGETAEAALTRELHEELGIRVRVGRRRIAIPHAPILLDVREIESFEGEPRAREHQRLRWVEPEHVERSLLPAADWPVLASLRLPDRYLITPVPAQDDETAFLSAIESALQEGIELVQLRLPGWPRERVAALARRVRDVCRGSAARILLNADWRLAAVLGLDGVHLPARVACTLAARPLGPDQWVAVSCHDLTELRHAAAIGADFATLSPIESTASHPAAATLGWGSASALLADAGLPVYALGGLGLAQQARALAAGFQGIAAIRAFWRANRVN